MVMDLSPCPIPGGIPIHRLDRSHLCLISDDDRSLM
jgi:hypothetical protein